MNRRDIAGVSTVVGAAAGAFLGAALLSGPVAAADDSQPPLPVPPFANETFFPSASEGAPTDVTGVPGLYTTEDIPFTTTEGSFVVQQTEFGSLPYADDTIDKVISSSGVAPAVGTEWDNSIVAVPVPLPTPVDGTSVFPFALIDYSSLTTPDGTVENFISPVFGSANNYYDGPAGTFDYLVYENGTSVPIIDIPASASAAADASTLGSDLGGML